MSYILIRCTYDLKFSSGVIALRFWPPGGQAKNQTTEIWSVSYYCLVVAISEVRNLVETYMVPRYMFSQD
jgi:uncharacterized membrane protein SpoIIM required for sporulation